MAPKNSQWNRKLDRLGRKAPSVFYLQYQEGGHPTVFWSSDSIL